MHSKLFSRRGVIAALICTAFALPAVAQAPLELKITAPAGAGGGWDGAARSLQQVMTATSAAKSVQVVNVPGAGGTVGLAQFVNSAKGDGNQLMVMGITMVGAVLTNKSPVTLEQVTPIARLTADQLVIVVPANSPHKTIKDLATAL
ncbi:MAG TPA: tripartite tricarboxylate transporter substrate-binding protein, partial [Ramlibacter sp.]|nr:tripartite tricarboxylate transporter substrate-binding protein [Ramlibacter sp.]